MPKGSAWINFIYVNLGFIMQVFAMYFFIQIKDIKDNWTKYRCNPIYMPLADDIASNFVFCIQSMQTNFMGYLLQPLQYVMSGLGEMSSGLVDDVGSARNMFSFVRGNMGINFENIFGVFLNIVIQFQKIILGFKDIIGKIVGIVTTIMHIIDGALKTMNSSWNGPPGQMVQAMGSCFHPETKIKLKTGQIVEIQHLHLGDVLENGSIVRALMKIDNSTEEMYYKFENKGVDVKDIHVTGSHMILNHDGKWIQVKDHIKSIPEKSLKTEWFSCLITSDHKIQIGEITFHDWEDYSIKEKMIQKQKWF